MNLHGASSHVRYASAQHHVAVRMDLVQQIDAIYACGDDGQRPCAGIVVVSVCVRDVACRCIQVLEQFIESVGTRDERSMLVHQSREESYRNWP